MSTNTGGSAVVQALRDNGVDTVFGIPGTHNLEIYRQLSAFSVRHVAPRHEQGGGYAADGYARVTGRPGVCITTTGPGLTNISTAAGTAYGDSIPMLVISPGVPRGMEGADVGWLHEVKDQSGHMDRLLDRSVRVESPGEAYAAIDEAFARWQVERPRPVHVEIPVDVLEESWDGEARRAAPLSPPALDEAAVRAAGAALSSAQQPLLVLGGGAAGAAGAAVALAEALDAPVLTTVNGKGVVPENHPLSAGASIRLAGAWAEIEAADAVLVVGSELGDSDLWGHQLRPKGTVIRVDIDERQLQKNAPADSTLHADAGAALTALRAAAARTSAGEGGARAAKLRGTFAEQAATDGGAWREVNEILASELPADAIVAGDSAQVSYFGTVHFWPASQPRQFIYPAGYATLGYGLPAAIGAKIAAPERTAAVLCGDGGFQFTALELATAAAAAEGLCIPIVVMNNRGYAEIREEMDGLGIPRVGVDFDVVDFAALGRACGGEGRTLDRLDQLPGALREALSTPRPTVIEVPVG
ncbi:MAG: 5-guanidino-2-oxopentanoate decarboxylase [Streptosporangiales bacterium]|nr:5-guanidino-2-oxopentanoate decarboxylase [Streptosporangiales bacterium]